MAKREPVRGLKKALLNMPGWARMAGIPVGTLRNVVYGKRSPRQETRWRMAAALRQQAAVMEVLADQLDPMRKGTGVRAAE